ncbi:MAG: DUF748 domain-containing protein [Formivibrio sp.]|nr:DUF748 domain-containing protein [Formivibrio sp.]
MILTAPSQTGKGFLAYNPEYGWAIGASLLNWNGSEVISYVWSSSMRFVRPFPRSVPKRVRTGVLVFVAMMLVYGLFGFFALPALLRPWLEKKAGAALHRQVSIGKIDINPFLFRVTLYRVAVNEKEGTLFQFASLTVDAELASLWRRGPVLREITLESPRVHIVRLSADRYNFSDLLDGQSKAPAQNPAPLPRFSLNNIRITGGSVDFDDQLLHAQQRISELQLALPFVSTLPYRLDEYIQPGLSGKLNGSGFKLTGQSKPFKDSRETRLSLQLNQLSLPQYLAYVPLPKEVNLPSGSLSGQVDVVFREEKDQPRLLIQGKLGLTDGRMDFRGEPLLTLPSVQIDLGNLEPLLQSYRIKHIGIDKPVLSVVRNAGGELNWLTAFASGQPAAKNASATASQPLVEVNDFALNEGRINWKDAAVKPGYAASIEAINLKAKHFSTAAKASAQVEIAFKTGFGEDFNAALQVQATPLSVDGHLALDHVQPGRYPPYLKPYFVGEIASGQLSTALDVHYVANPQVLEINHGAFGISDLAIRLAGEKQASVKLAALNASGIGLNLGKQLVDVANLNISGSENNIVMSKDGRINLLNLLPPAPGHTTVANKINAPSWRVRLMQLALEKSTLRLEDHRQSGTPPLVLSEIGLKVENLDSAPGSPAKLDFSAKSGKRGLIKVAGPFVPAPFSAKWQLDLRQFDAAFTQPYFTDLLNIRLASIWLAARGEAQIATAPKLAVRYRGNFSVNDLYAIDKTNGEDFLKWRSLALTGVDVQSEPLKLALREVALTDFYSRLILSKEGKLNLQDIVVKEGQATSVTTSPATSVPAVAKPVAIASAPVSPRAPLPPISIGKITLSGGNIVYTDNFIQPNFTANLLDMGGVIGGLSSSETARASLDLRGSVDRIAPVAIAGNLNPLAQKIFLDIKAAVKGYELTAASTYSAKYAGYGIEKGKLSMDVSYFIEDNKLKASNQLTLDQLTLGDKVDSPDATKLPVKFALALLTDRRGQINLSLPIEGSLDDPQFRIGKIIWQVIGNLLEKAITSPFSALGSLFGGNQATFSRVEFEPGRATLSAAAKEALGNLAKALDDRPALKLDIAGWVASDADREGLKRAKLEEKIRARKLAQLTDKGQSVDTTTELTIGPEERNRLLGQVYDREKFPKPRNIVGLQKSLPPAEMEKLILANTTVTDDDLRNLGLQRATVAKDALKELGVDEARLFILRPRLDPPADELKKEGGKATRAQFVLK